MRKLTSGGLLIAVEGVDGAGKTTIAALLAQFCGERGLGCVLSKEPTSLGWGQKMRESAQTERLSLEKELEYFLLDRKDHVERTIRPALEENAVVILDRYYWSTAAYQGVRGASVEKIITENETFAPMPDLFILLDVEVKAGLDRVQKRGDTPNSFEKVDALEQARQIFLGLHQKYPDRSCKIDALRPFREINKEAQSQFLRVAVSKILNNFKTNPERESKATLNEVLKLLGAALIP